MAILATRIQLCGRLVVRIGGRRVERELPGRQGRLAFAYLATNRVRPIPRPELAEALWPDRLPGNVDASLAALVSKLRRAVGANALTGRSTLDLVLPEGALIDVEAAFEAIHRAEGAIGRGEAFKPSGASVPPSCVTFATRRTTRSG